MQTRIEYCCKHVDSRRLRFSEHHRTKSSMQTCLWQSSITVVWSTIRPVILYFRHKCIKLKFKLTSSQLQLSQPNGYYTPHLSSRYCTTKITIHALILCTDLSPIPVSSAIKSYLASWHIRNLSKCALSGQTVCTWTAELGRLFRVLTNYRLSTVGSYMAVVSSLMCRDRIEKIGRGILWLSQRFRATHAV